MDRNVACESVIIVGGGLAGLSAATALAEAGLRVRLFEKRPYLGGRATSYALPDGTHIDNCQHVTLGCCTNLANFYERTGESAKIRHYRELYFADRRGRISTIKSSALPPPFHTSLSFLRFGALGYADKKAIAEALLCIAHSGGQPRDVAGKSMLEWLQANGQTDAAIRRFWRVVLVSALDEELAFTDAHYGIDVFWKAFLMNREGYVLGIPSVPLGDLYAGCRKSIESKGGEIRARTPVRKLLFEDHKFLSVVFDDGSEQRADACIAALPHDALLEILPETMRSQCPTFANLNCLQTSPITGVHLWYDRPVLDRPFLTLLDHTTQWIFNRSAMQGLPGREQKPPGQYLQLVISASYDFIPRGRQEIIELCVQELGEVLPLSKTASLLKATVVKEVNATFSPRPGVDRWRPEQTTEIHGLFLAGDWTRTGWPSTMEGAVRSGCLAAERVLESAGAKRRLLVPDLPAEGFCRRWRKKEV